MSLDNARHCYHISTTASRKPPVGHLPGGAAKPLASLPVTRFNHKDTRKAASQKVADLLQAGVTHARKAKTAVPAAKATGPGKSAQGAAPALQGKPQAAATKAAAVSPVAAGGAARSALWPLDGPGEGTAERFEKLQVLAAEVAGCTRCDALVANRSRTVFGVGAARPRLVFFGEAPGADEDRQGEPFVGRAGQLLDRILAACTLKCRPPDNRPPQPDEIANCRPYFERQLEILRPEFICCLGSVAAKTLLSTELTIGRLRGVLHDYRGVRVLCTYHPAYLLRNPAAKKETWADMQLLLAAMGVQLPPAAGQ
jgi:uracil-DNA glycosylase